MARQHYILIALGVLIFTGWVAHYFHEPSEKYAGLSCSGQNVATFGWTHKDRARAELAAILRWKHETNKLGLGKAYGEWHHAQRRNMQCRIFGGERGSYQCAISALPCRPADTGPGV